MRNQCAGVLGWLFGHKFLVSKGGYVRWSNPPACYRCGKVKG